MRLFLIILLGESVLSIGRAISGDRPEPLTLLAGLGGFVALVSLWFTYFGAADWRPSPCSWWCCWRWPSTSPGRGSRPRQAAYPSHSRG
jgi:hypothetical protein